MKKVSITTLQDPEGSNSQTSSADVPLWLLQKDDTPFLFLSIFLSVTVHVVFFLLMAATRIFHPFEGTSLEFDLLWLSPSPAATPAPGPSPKVSISKGKSAQKAKGLRPAKKKPSKRPPAKTASSSRRIAAKPSSSKIPPRDRHALVSPKIAVTAPSEKIMYRFGGKVVEILDKETTAPVFTVMSGVRLRSPNARAIVRTIKEMGPHQEKIRKPLPKRKPPEATEPTFPEEVTTRKDGKKPVTATVTQKIPDKSTEDENRENPIQDIVSTSPEIPEPANLLTAQTETGRPITPFVAALGTLSSEGKILPDSGAVSPSSGKETENATEAPGSPGQPGENPPVPAEETVISEASTAEKQAPRETENRRHILQPALTGELKLVVTCDKKITTEIFFKKYATNRRSKPFTRKESESRRSIQPITAQTDKDVFEVVVESAEEGIYSIIAKSADGKPADAKFVLKIRESTPRAITKKLGRKTVTESSEIARILMPEGILWDDDSYFSGNIEDSESITKFHSETELMWKEYK